MSTCKDCLHYEVCQYHITEETDMTVNECSHGFKNRAEYVEVVRCKECENCRVGKNSRYCTEHSDGFGSHIVYVDEDDYCSYGIRKESEVRE